MGLPIHDLAVSGIELIFGLTDELKKPFTFIINKDHSETTLAYDPVTRTYPVTETKETPLTVTDVRYVCFKADEILNSNGTLTLNSRKVYLRYADLNAISINETDQGELPDGNSVEIKSIKYIPEVDPVFVRLIIEGVNDAISINS
jgi:hypothetical protein